MATMVKEKRREKKKVKEKPRIKSSMAEDVSLPTFVKLSEEANICTPITVEQELKTETIQELKKLDEMQTATPISSTFNIQRDHSAGESSAENKSLSDICQTFDTNTSINSQMLEINNPSCVSNLEDVTSPLELVKADQTVTNESFTDNYQYLNRRLDCLTIPKTEQVSDARELELSSTNAYLKPSPSMAEKESMSEIVSKYDVEDVMPSAPAFEENVQPQGHYHQEIIEEIQPKLQCMPLEMAVKIYGGAEMDAVKTLSEKEEAIVEAGPVSSPDHPLVDLLSTFRSSLRAVENERTKLASGLADEEQSRSTLWKIEKRNIYQKKECKCGMSVELRAVYEHAELLKERLPVARLRLEGLLRDIQESYCHYQHAALLAHCQIEEFISETVDSNKMEIRTALSLVLQALRVCDGAAVLAAVLRRWAAALAAALVDERDVRQTLFLLHHLFRQSRSVRWAARVFSPRVPDAAAAARTLALLDTLLASPKLEAAVECTEEDEEWEEVSARGAGGAVREGALREIDLLALMHTFPLRDLVARILMFTHADIRQARPYEWGDATGGCEMIRACCGVRALLASLHRAALAHPHYARLNAKLRDVAAATLEALACLYHSPRAPYLQDLEERIVAELEACFTAAFVLFGSRELHKLTTTLLSEHTAKDYCFTFMLGLHDKSPKHLASLEIEVPVLPCDVRVRIITAAAVFRDKDHELARIVLDFLFQTGAKVKSSSCKAGCVAAARECLPKLIAAHPYLRVVALHTVANMAQVECLDPSVVDLLQVEEWRPQCDELQAVLRDWAQRCPLLLQQLLLQLDCTPYTGISLEAQLALGSWVCERARSQPASAEHCWRVLLRLRTHRACWDAPAATPDIEATDQISSAFAVLAGDCGNCIPLICSVGVEALCSLAARPRAAVHCLAPVMLVMAQSPESVSLTPKFGELFTSLLSCGPSLVQRALGRAAPTGQELLLRLALSQIEREPSDLHTPRDTQKERSGAKWISGIVVKIAKLETNSSVGSAPRASVLSVWLHALWRVPAAGAAAILDAAALAARDWPAIDAHAAALLLEENAQEHVTNAVRNVSTAPLLCECLLRAYTQREVNMRTFAAVANILWEQRINNQRIHVDNALQKLKAECSSDSLAIYQCAAGALGAPAQHPAHLTLWRLFMHLYLQRPPHNMQETAMPVGPLFFSGLIKSRTLSQIKKRLQETATYHSNEAEKYKIVNSEPPERPNRVQKSESITIEKGLLPTLSIKDFTGETGDSSDDSEGLSESEEEGEVKERQVDASDAEKKRVTNMACYHTAAERMVREFCTWLEEGDRCRASPHHADIARFIPEQALEEAWKSTLSRLRPPPSPELDDFPRPAGAPDTPPLPEPTPLHRAVTAIMGIKDNSGTRSRRLIKSPIEDIDFTDSRSLLAVVDKHLKDIDQLAKEWSTEVSRVSSLDGALWQQVAGLRVPRPLPPVTKPCPNANTKCKPTVFHINEREWCISTGVERGIKENRSSWRAGVRRLARARPLAARNSAALHSIARRVRSSGAAVCAVERAWRGAARQPPCPAADLALAALLGDLAERWICSDGRLVADLLSRWCSKPTNQLQQALCGALVSPRRMDLNDWPLVYTALLNAKLPSHTIFSYLSKFEMSHWSQSASQSARRDLLDSLLSAHVCFGPAPAADHSILLELIGVHTTALIDDQELCASAVKFARAAVQGKLPPRQWACVVRAAELVGQGVGFDQLGHLLRELGVLWWEARAHHQGTLAAHAPHVAALLRTLLRAFVRAATALSYEPERVGRCAWAAASEAWGAWLAPHPSLPPLLPSLTSDGGEYSAMLQAFVGCLEDIMADCPGSSVAILQQVFEWGCASHAGSQAGASQEGRVQASELLARLARLPWGTAHWFYGTSLHTAIQMCATNDRELMSWACATWKNTLTQTFLRDVTEDSIAPRLASILYLFTGTPLQQDDQVIKQATRLPWRKLPTAAVGEALDRFFAVHHNSSIAYHDIPQFELLLFASELKCWPGEVSGEYSEEKRARAVSQWALAGAAPPARAHVAAHTRLMLGLITDLGVSYGAGARLEELLGRASVVMCMEPAAAAALPVWQSWVSGVACARAAAACVSCACALTALPYCAALADAAVRAYMRADGTWSEIGRRWAASSPWSEPELFASRACTHAAYACAAARAWTADTRAALVALRTAELDFVEHEVILGVWICYACRVARSCAASATSGAAERGAAARALLRAWAQPPRRSLLRAVTLRPRTDCATPLHQVLCRLAECILSPSAEGAQAYEAACGGAGLPADLTGRDVTGRRDVTAWGPALLPTLARRLYPKHEKYFQLELEAVEDSR